VREVWNNYLSIPASEILYIKETTDGIAIEEVGRMLPWLGKWHIGLGGMPISDKVSTKNTKASE